MNPRGSRAKGANAERELAKLLVKWGIPEAARMPMSGAIPDLPGDVRINGWCVEAKRTERLDLWGAWRQVCAAARGGATPIVFFRRNNTPWMATVEAETWASMECELREWRRWGEGKTFYKRPVPATRIGVGQEAVLDFPGGKRDKEREYEREWQTNALDAEGIPLDAEKGKA